MGGAIGRKSVIRRESVRFSRTSVKHSYSHISSHLLPQNVIPRYNVRMGSACLLWELDGMLGSLRNFNFVCSLRN